MGAGHVPGTPNARQYGARNHPDDEKAQVCLQNLLIFRKYICNYGVFIVLIFLCFSFFFVLASSELLLLVGQKMICESINYYLKRKDRVGNGHELCLAHVNIQGSIFPGKHCRRVFVLNLCCLLLPVFLLVSKDTECKIVTCPF